MNAPFRAAYIRYLLVVAAALCLLAFVASWRVRTLVLESRQRALHDQSRMVYALVVEDLRAGRIPEIRAKLNAIAQASDLRITLIEESGLVLADTQADPSQMENHRLREEVVKARSQGEGVSERLSGTVHQMLLYLATRMEDPRGGPCYLRLAVPVVRLKSDLADWDSGILGVSFLALLLAASAGWFWFRNQSRVLEEFLASAGAVAGGQADARPYLATGLFLNLGQALAGLSEAMIGARAEARARQEELSGLLESMTEGVLTTDRQGTITLANRAAAGLLELSGAPGGQTLLSAIREEPLIRAVREVLVSGQPQTVACGPVRGRHLSIVLSPLGRTPPSGLLLVIRDVTQATQYQELRKGFVANVSHELRTPLTLIRGFVETLQSGAWQDPQAAPRHLAIIEKHVKQLENLIDDLLEISRLESQQGFLRKSEVDLREIARTAVELTGTAARNRGHRVELELPDDPLNVHADPSFLERAVTNLVDNAIKYTTEQGRILVRAMALPEGMAVEVEDNGIGIPEADLPRIFERFYRVDKSRSREMGGTGLGLAIVKHIAEAHGGRVEVWSQPGKGSRFRLLLPVEETD